MRAVTEDRFGHFLDPLFGPLLTHFLAKNDPFWPKMTQKWSKSGFKTVSKKRLPTMRANDVYIFGVFDPFWSKNGPKSGVTFLDIFDTFREARVGFLTHKLSNR